MIDSPVIHQKINSANKPRIGELMLQRGLITNDQLKIALTEQEKNSIPLGRHLVRLGFVSESIVRDLVAQNLGQESLDLSTVVADADAILLVPEDFARKHQLLPILLDKEKNSFLVAMANTFNVVALDQLKVMLPEQFEITVVLATEVQIEECIDQFYGYELSVDGILHEIETGEIDYQSLQNIGDEYTQPIVRLVTSILMDAAKRNASDIHFEPEHSFIRIRYRIDGVLQQIRSLHRNFWPAILVRLKVISGMDIAEMRMPQDGRIQMNLCGRPIDFRVSSHPTIHGENIVLRLLDRQKSIIQLAEMGLDSDRLNTLKLMLQRPEGIIIITGPTGSGKTTTLYALLSHLNKETVNIMTLEDPVEYPVGSMRQTSVTELNKVNFASGIRSIMRQDPDIILVGEVRDEETAKMAFRAAMTGHQVFTTLHTNSSLGVFPRLSDIGINADILAGNIIGVIAQRLVRVLCKHCKVSSDITSIERIQLNISDTKNISLYHSIGCPHCGFTGYRGRRAVFELLIIDAEMDALISRGASLDELQALARKNGLITLADDARRLVLEGKTTLDEITRVVNITNLAS